MAHTTWQFYRGIDTIGGTIIVLRNEQHRLIFDMGRIFNPSVPVFDAAIPARGIHDLQAMGIAPKIDGLFEDGTEVDRVHTLVAVSHSHLDHTGLLPFLRKDIPVVVHEDTFKLLRCLDEVLDGPKRDLNYLPKEAQSKIDFGPFRLTLVPVDHDTPGACAFLIEAPDMRFVYSGDLRLHGAYPETTRAFVRQAADFAPDVLFIEGTRALDEDNSKMLFEHQLASRIIEIVETARQGVYFSFYPRHPDRLNAFVKAARVTGRKLLIQAPHAYIYSQFGGDLTGTAIYGGGRENWSEKLRRWVEELELCVVTPEELRGNEQAYIVNFDYDRFRDWIDIHVEPGGVFLHSNGSPLGPFDPAWNNMKYWLEQLGLAFTSAGSTGHAARGDILSIVKTISPRVLMPIHSLQPQRIGLTSVRRIMPRYNHIYTARDLDTAQFPSEKDMEPV